MTTYTIKAPNGVTYEIEGPEGASQEQVAQAVLARNPEAGQPSKAKGGFKAAVSGGVDNLQGSLYALAGRTGAMDMGRAEEGVARNKREAAAAFKPTEDDWTESPWLKFKETLGGSLPYMAAPVAAGAAVAAAPLTGLAATAAGLGAVGLTSGAQFTATNLDRQMDEGKALKDTNLTNAMLAAAPQAALDMIGLGKIPGVRQMIGLVAKDVGKDAAVKIAGQTAKQVALDYAKATGTAMGAEGITEAAQQVLERMQAGLAINDPAARKEYWDSLIGGAVLGGALAPAGRFVERGKIEGKQAEQAQVEKAAAAKAAATAAEQQQVLQTQQAAQKAELDAQRGVPAAQTADESGETVQTPAIASTLAKAYQDRADALVRAGQAAKSGDFDSAKTAQDEAAQHAAVIRTLSPLKEEAPVEPPAPREMQLAEIQKRLVQLQGTEKKPGLYEKALRLGENEVADEHLGEMRDLQTQLKALQGNAAELGARDASLRQQKPSPDPVNPMAAFMADTEGLDQQRSESEGIRKEVAVGKEIADMEAGRLDTTRTDQRTLFDRVGIEGVAVDNQAAANQLRQQLSAQLRDARRSGDRKAADIALEKLQDMKTRKGVSESTNPLPVTLKDEYLTGPAKPATDTAGTETTPTPTTATVDSVKKQIAALPVQLAPHQEDMVQRVLSNLPAIAQDSSRLAQVSDYLYGLQTGRTERPVADDGAADNFRSRDMSAMLDMMDQGKLQDNGQKKLLDGGTQIVENAPLSYMQMGPRKVTQVEAPRVFSSSEAFQKYLGGEALDKLRKMLGLGTQTVQLAMKKIVPLQKRIDQLTDSIAAERDKYERTKQYGEVMAEDADAKHAAAQARFDAVIQRLDAELIPLQADYLKAQTELKEAVEYAKDINETIAANRGVAGPAAIQKIQHFQGKLAQELKAVEQLSVAFVRAKSDLERVAKNQKQRVTTQRAINSAAGETFDAAKERVETVQGTRDALQETQSRRQELRSERSGMQKQVDDILRPINEARDARLPKVDDSYDLRRTPEDTVRSQERDAEAGRQRIKEQARRERLDAIPGERVDNSKYRKARDAAPPDQLRAERMALLEEKSLDESLPKTTRDAAARLVRKMKIEDSATETRSNAQAELDRLTDERIPDLQQQVADAPSTSNKQELARAKRAAKKLRALLQRAKRTDVAEEATATEPVEPGVRSEIKGRANVATRKEITPGEQRTGSAESIAGENKTGNANKIKEKRVVQERNTAVGRKEQQQANDEAAALLEGKPSLDKSMADWFAETTNAIRTQIKTLQAELTEANAKVEDIQKRPTKFSPEDRTNADRLVRAIESEIESAQAELDKRIEATREEDGPPDTLQGRNVTTLNGTDWSGEREAWDADGGAVFRTAKAAGPGMKSAEVSRVANRVMEGWTNVPDVTVVERESDLPQRIQDQAKRDNMTGRVPGLFDPDTGSVFLVAENLHSGNDVALTIAHEVAGHYGLRDMMGKDYAPIMNRLYNGNADIKTAADARMKASPNMSKEVAVEESLAEMAEAPNAKSGAKAVLSRVYFAIKSWLAQRLGIKNVSDAEVQQIVANARRHVKRGTRNNDGPGGSKGSVYRSAPSDTHEGIDAPRLFPDSTDTRGWYQRMTDGLGMALETGIVDMHAPLFRALRAAGGESNKNAMQAMYMSRKANQSINVVQQSLAMSAPEWTAPDKRGLVGARAGSGPSGGAVLEKIQAVPGKTGEDKVALTTEYLAALRAVQKGGHILGEGGLEKAKALIAAVKKNPEAYVALEAVRAIYKEYNTKLIHFARDSGAITEAEAKEYLEGDYVPMYRNNNGKLEMSLSDDRFVSMGDISHTPFLHKLKGSDASIMPLNESIIYNTKLLVDMAMSNMQKRNIAYAMDEVGTAAKKKGTMHVLPGQGDKADPKVINWREKSRQEGDDGYRHLILDTEGTVMEGVPTDVLANALQGFHATMPAYVRAAAVMNDYLRAGVTRTPVYAFRQLMRDPMAAASVTGLKAGPFRAVFNTLGNYANAYKTDAKNFDELNRRALVQSNIMTGDVDDMAKLGLQIGGPDGASAVRKFLNIMDRSAHNADAANRLQIWEDAKAQGLSDIEAEYRVMESMNFHKRGAWETVQHANRILPFFNSAIQGLNVAVKALQGKMPFEERLKVKQKFMHNAMFLAVAGFAYAAAMEDDDEYAGLAPEDKLGNLHIPLPGGGFFKMPLAYVDTGGLAWALGQYLVQQDADGADFAQINKALGKYVLNAVPGGGAVPLPPVLKQVVEGVTNTDLRTFRPIVSKGLEQQTPDQQYNASTLESYKAIGAAIGVSPIKLQRAVDSLFSSAANGVVGLAETVVGAGEQEGVEKPSKEVSRLPFISSFTQNDKSSGAVGYMYEKAQESIGARDTLNKMKNEGRSREDLIAYRDENRVEIALAPMGQAYITQMAQLSKAIKQTREAKGIPGDVKAERIKGWEKQQRELATKFKARMQEVRERLEATAA